MKPLLRRLLLWVVLPVLLVALAVWSWTPREPSWEGRSLSEWLKDLEASRIEKLGVVDEKQAEAARQAIQGMGTNCLPFLLRRMETKGPTPIESSMVKLEEHFGKYAGYLPWELGDGRRGAHVESAYYALLALGQQAAPAVPELQRSLFSTILHKDYFAADLLPNVHPEGTTALIVASTNTMIPRRRFVVGALHRLAPDHPEALAALLRLNVDPDPNMRALLGRVLARGGYEATIIWPVLNRLLNDPDGSVRRAILRELDSFKGDAGPAVPSLTALLTDPDPEISSQAKALLDKIKAQSATPPPAP